MTLEHKKQNLVLIPGFVTNSTILEKPINYLKKFFNIYCIDLPGLGAPGRLNDFSLASYGKYVTEQINELNLDSYILEGVSFGFGVASHVAVDDRCRGIIAFYPYVGADSLNFEKRKYNAYRRIAGVSRSNLLRSLVWWRPVFDVTLARLANFDREKSDMVRSMFDPKTLLLTAHKLINENIEPIFHDVPYLLVVNKDDQIINYDKVVNFFDNHNGKLKIIENTMPHYPDQMHESYIERFLTHEFMTEMDDYFRNN